jgi:hypothetical protein
VLSRINLSGRQADSLPRSISVGLTRWPVEREILRSLVKARAIGMTQRGEQRERDGRQFLEPALARAKFTNHLQQRAVTERRGRKG